MLIKVLTKIRKNLPLILIVLVAFLVRASRIDFLPPALNWDEVSHGYNAFSILKTGKDEWGRAFPLIFRAFGDYKLPVYIYLTAISEFFLGLTPLAVRLPSILAGTGSVLFTYLLVKELFKTKEIALLSAFLLALEPWGLFLSRVAVEANVSVFLIIAGTYFFLKKKSLRAALLFGLSVWTYNSARVFAPLLLLSLHHIYKPKFNLKYILLVALFFLPMLYQLANPVGQARYSEVRIVDQGTVARLVENRNKMNLPNPLPRAIHNKITYFGAGFAKNYFSHFNPKFLFSTGGSDYQFNVQGHGLLYIINLPFLILGVITIVKKARSSKAHRLILVWLMLSPIASSLTRGAPHALRSMIVLPLPMVLSSLGLVSAWGLLRSKRVRLLFSAIYIFALGMSVENYAMKAVFEYRETYSWSWQYGYEQVVDYVRDVYNDYDKVVITKKYGEPHEFFLFHWPWDPLEYQIDPNLNRFEQSNWFWVDAFDKFYFVNDWQVEDLVLESGGEIDCLSQSCLLVTSPNNAPKGFTKIKTIKFLDGVAAFEIYDKAI